jgi:protein subunit release factor A
MVTPAVVAEHSCGISVQVGVLRSQHQNRTLAMVVLALALDFAEHLESGTMSKEELQAIWNARYGNTAVENKEADEETNNKV